MITKLLNLPLCLALVGMFSLLIAADAYARQDPVLADDSRISDSTPRTRNSLSTENGRKPNPTSVERFVCGANEVVSIAWQRKLESQIAGYPNEDA